MKKMRAVPLDLWTNEDLIALPTEVKWTAIGLRNHADDFGRETTTDWMLRPSIWPGSEEVTESVLVDHLLLLDEVAYIGIYSSADRSYYVIREWPAVSHPQPSRHPAPPPDLFRQAAGSDLAAFSAMERESEWSEESPDQQPTGLPPNPFCKVHRPTGSGGRPCVRCQDARLAHDQWIREERLERG